MHHIDFIMCGHALGVSKLLKVQLQTLLTQINNHLKI